MANDATPVVMEDPSEVRVKLKKGIAAFDDVPRAVEL